MVLPISVMPSAWTETGPLQEPGDYSLGGVFGNVTITSPGVTLRDHHVPPHDGGGGFTGEGIVRGGGCLAGPLDVLVGVGDLHVVIEPVGHLDVLKGRGKAVFAIQVKNFHDT